MPYRKKRVFHDEKVMKTKEEKLADEVAAMEKMTDKENKHKMSNKAF